MIGWEDLRAFPSGAVYFDYIVAYLPHGGVQNAAPGAARNQRGAIIAGGGTCHSIGIGQIALVVKPPRICVQGAPCNFFSSNPLLRCKCQADSLCMSRRRR